MEIEIMRNPKGVPMGVRLLGDANEDYLILARLWKKGIKINGYGGDELQLTFLDLIGAKEFETEMPDVRDK